MQEEPCGFLDSARIAVGVMPSRAKILLLVAWFPWTTDGVMMIPGRRCSLAGLRVDVLATELLAAFEAPGFTTAVAD